MNKRGTGATISTAENKAVYRIRLMVMFFLTMSTIGTACLVYFNARNSEQEQFEADFEYLASKVFNHLGSSIEASLGAIDGFVVSIVSFALHSNMTWPYVTIPDYGTRASKVRSVTRSVLIAEIRIIRSSQRAKWDEYSLEVGPSWVDENIAVQNSDPTFTGMRVDEYNVSGLWGSQPGATFNLPMWQSYPTLPLFGYSPFNLDLTLLPSLSLALPALKERKAVVGGISNAPGGDSGAQTNELIKFYTENESTITEPLSELYYPIFEDAAAQVLAGNTSGAAMASILGTWFYWRDFMKDILPSGNNGIIVVFENGCNQTFSYRIDGPDVIFLGYLDAHDRKYNVYEVVSTLINLLRHSRGNQVYTGLLLADEICPYNVRLYPSETFEDHYVDSDPIMYMSMTIAIFVFTTLVFLCYDFLMERRQKKLLSTGK